MRERRNERGKEKKNVKKKGKGENGVYLPLRRIICVVSSCVTEGVRDVCVLFALILSAMCYFSVVGAVRVAVALLTCLHFCYHFKIWLPVPWYGRIEHPVSPRS